MYTVIMIRKDLTILLDIYDKFYHINFEYYRDYLLKKHDKTFPINHFKNKNNLSTLKCNLFFRKLKNYEPELINLVEYYIAINIEKYIINILDFLKLYNVHTEKKNYNINVNLNSIINTHIVSDKLTNNILIFEKIFNKLFNTIDFLKYSLQKTFNSIENNKIKLYNLNVLLNFTKSKKKIIDLLLKNLENKNIKLNLDMKLYENKINLLFL